MAVLTKKHWLYNNFFTTLKTEGSWVCVLMRVCLIIENVSRIFIFLFTQSKGVTVGGGCLGVGGWTNNNIRRYKLIRWYSKIDITMKKSVFTVRLQKPSSGTHTNVSLNTLIIINYPDVVTPKCHVHSVHNQFLKHQNHFNKLLSFFFKF